MFPFFSFYRHSHFMTLSEFILFCVENNLHKSGKSLSFLSYFIRLGIWAVNFSCGFRYETFCRIQGTNFDILVQTPGRLASAHPMPHDMMPARK